MAKRWVFVVAVVALVAVAFGAFVLTRPAVQATTSVDPDVTVVCRASAGTPDACRAWGDAILEAGPPSTTFEMQDLARLVISRGLFGLAATCEVSYAIQRYPDEPVWDEETRCREG